MRTLRFSPRLAFLLAAAGLLLWMLRSDLNWREIDWPRILVGLDRSQRLPASEAALPAGEAAPGP